MRISWLVRRHHPVCLLFFSGFGMDAHPFATLDWGERDVLLLSDYRHIGPLDLQPLSCYQHLEVLAWSLGVCVAARVLASLPRSPLLSVAIGGTLTGIHPRTGIAPAAIQQAIADFSPSWLENFYRSMFDNTRHLQRFLDHRPQRPLQEVLAELRRLRDYCSQSIPPADCFTSHILLSRDRVLPARNQQRAWGRGRYSTLKAPHFPFYQYPPAPAILTP